MVPQFHVAGKRLKLPFRDALVWPKSLIEQVSIFQNERQSIPNIINPNMMMSVSSQADTDADYSWFMPVVQVKSLDHIPERFDHHTFPTSLYARFRFISNHSLDELNMHIADDMFDAIDNFMDSEEQKYFLERKRFNIDKFDLLDKDENYVRWEWFAPVIKKTSLKIPSFSPSGIKKVTKQELPALRFIGKKYFEPPEPQNVLKLLADWQLNRWFDAIENQSGIDYKTFYEGTDAYVSLVRKKDGSFEHWMGMFTPKGTEVPQGYEMIDFPKMTIGVCCVYGKRGEIINYENECRNKLTEEGFAIENAPRRIREWFFRRFNWHRFFEEDIYGKRLLDYCYPICGKN